MPVQETSLGSMAPSLVSRRSSVVGEVSHGSSIVEGHFAQAEVSMTSSASVSSLQQFELLPTIYEQPEVHVHMPPQRMVSLPHQRYVLSFLLSGFIFVLL